MERAKISILDLTASQLKDLMDSFGEPVYRAEQLLKWIYQKLAFSFEEMSDLPYPLREKLQNNTVLFNLSVIEGKTSANGLTRKILFKLIDGKTIESTFMSYTPSSSGRERRTVCVSSQVGCPIGCYFCATGQQGFERNLRPGEIIEQVLYFARSIKKEIRQNDLDMLRKAVTNVVFMGMGEPLANYDNVWQAIQMLNSKNGLELGARQITVSTVGLVPQIRRLALESLHVELAVSLHAGNDELRGQLLPINKKYPLAVLIPACKDYFDKTGRRPTFEYALFQNVNDYPDNARELALLLKGLNCSVNLIVGNPTSCQEYKPSSLLKATAFRNQLSGLGIASTIRISRGTDIEAGCGQLKSRWTSKQ